MPTCVWCALPTLWFLGLRCGSGCVWVCLGAFVPTMGVCMPKAYVSVSVSDVGFAERRSAERSRREMVRYCRICEAWGYFACGVCVLVAYLSGAIG